MSTKSLCHFLVVLISILSAGSVFCNLPWTNPFLLWEMISEVRVADMSYNIQHLWGVCYIYHKMNCTADISFRPLFCKGKSREFNHIVLWTYIQWPKTTDKNKIHDESSLPGDMFRKCHRQTSENHWPFKTTFNFTSVNFISEIWRSWSVLPVSKN